MRQFDNGALGVTENQDIGLGIGQHRTAHLVRPVIVMGDAPQAGFDGTDHHIAARISFAATLGINRHRPVRPLVGLGVGRVGIVRAGFAVRSVAIDHRIHVAGGDAEKQVRLAEAFEVRRRIPVRLTENADAETLRFEQAADQRHAEAGVIDIGVASNQNDVARIPSEGIHFGARHGQKGGWTETMSPEFAVAEQRVRHLMI